MASWGILPIVGAMAQDETVRRAAMSALKKYRDWVKKKSSPKSKTETKPEERKGKQTYSEAGKETAETISKRKRSQQKQLADIMKDL